MKPEERDPHSEADWRWTLLLATAAGVARLIPHPWNFTPVGALGLFTGSRLRPWLAAVVPLAVMALSDLLLLAVKGDHPFNPYVYASFVLTVLCGHFFLRSPSLGRIAAVSLLSSVLFFVITNFGVWLSASAGGPDLPVGQPVVMEHYDQLPYPVPIRYARTPAGLAACFTLALPFFETNAPPLGFFGNQVLGDLVYCFALFGLGAWTGRLFGPVRAAAPSLSAPLRSP